MEPLNPALPPSVFIVASGAEDAALWVARLEGQGLQAAWLDPRSLSGEDGAASASGGLLSHQPEVWLLLEEAWLKPVLQRGQPDPRQPPVLMLLAPEAMQHASVLLAAGAADVWSRDLPIPLLARRLQMQIQLRRHQRALAKQLRYEAAVAECARMLVGRGGLDQHLQRVVEILQAASDVSRAYVFRNHQDPDQGLLVSQVHEACAPGVEPQIHNPQLQDQPFANDAPNALALLGAGEPFVGLVRDLPEPEQSLLGCQGILSVLILPIFSGEEFWGFIGFDDCVQATHWHPDEIALLRIVAETTGLAIERQMAEDELYLMAVRDSLTGLYNRRHLNQQLIRLVSQAGRDQLQFSIALLDIDWFKRINDSYGHPAGDAVLRHFAQALERGCRSYDLLGRYGGEEFLVAILHADAQQLVQRLQHLRNTLRASPVRFQGRTIPVSFSAGIASSAELHQPFCADDLIALIDRRLYSAKQLGRDRIADDDVIAAI
jgi:diguanylate cyclase (GGDEF)-like protein